MASQSEKYNAISKVAQHCKTLVDLYGPLVVDDALWAGSPNYNGAITQGDLDANPNFGGLTHQQLADAEFALATIKTQINTSLTQLLVLAGLA